LLLLSKFLKLQHINCIYFRPKRQKLTILTQNTAIMHKKLS
jgi:hypothetical protein